MSDQNPVAGKWIGIVVVALIVVNLYSGLVAKKIGIPGIFEVEFGPKESPQPKPTPAPSVEQPSPTPIPTIDLTKLVSQGSSALPKPNTDNYYAPPPPPQNYNCPYRQGMFQMPYPQTWYGPFGPGFAIGWYQGGGFGVWNPYSYQTQPYPDPYRTVQRNNWLRLPNAPFNICIDNYGYVYGEFMM